MRLASDGFAAAAPNLYHRLECADADKMSLLKQLKDVELLADVEATVELLREQEPVDSDALGITGYCMGGRVAYPMAAAVPEFRASVAYYGGNTMVPWGEGITSPFDRTSEISCPLMFHFGEEDGNPSTEDRDKLDVELSRHGKEHVFYTYPDAGHAFLDFTREERYRPDADAASWPRTIEFFRTHLT